MKKLETYVDVERRGTVRRCGIRIRPVVLLLGLGFVLAGCATTQGNRGPDIKEMLASAGFKMWPADTPEKLARLEAFPQRELVRQEQRDGKVQYLYADATFCRCAYVGTEEAYRRYQQLAQEKKVDHERAMAARAQSGAMDWRRWSAWGTYP